MSLESVIMMIYLKVDDQGIYYKKVMINYNSDYKITTRLYIAPNPVNMHEMIKVLVYKNLTPLFANLNYFFHI